MDLPGLNSLTLEAKLLTMSKEWKNAEKLEKL